MLRYLGTAEINKIYIQKAFKISHLCLYVYVKIKDFIWGYNSGNCEAHYLLGRNVVYWELLPG
jgi:hypothetical protein